MARNSEKAMTALARWRAAQLKEARGPEADERRPYLTTECTNIKKCEKWRVQVIKEISKKVSQIQNAGLGEFKIRDMNDEINKLLREKLRWEQQIIDLGGKDYRRFGPRMLTQEGKEVPGNRGYKYFGAAKDLPGVRELFQGEIPNVAKKTRAELAREVDADYFGYMDEDDGILMPLEEAEEKISRANAVERWKIDKEARMESEGLKDTKPEVEAELSEEDILYHQARQFEAEEREKLAAGGESSLLSAKQLAAEYNKQKQAETAAKKLMTLAEADASGNILDANAKRMESLLPAIFKAHVEVPTQKDVEAALLHRKKMELLKQYVSDELLMELDDDVIADDGLLPILDAVASTSEDAPSTSAATDAVASSSEDTPSTSAAAAAAALVDAVTAGESSSKADQDDSSKTQNSSVEPSTSERTEESEGSFMETS